LAGPVLCYLASNFACFLAQICRAFPSLLGLEVDRHLTPIVEFLRCV
jgi:hypothetical protein